jgi:hypothetical protein
VIDRASVELRRYHVDLIIDPPASAGNDFVTNVVQLQPNDDGVRRVSIAAKFETTNWTPILIGIL